MRPVGMAALARPLSAPMRPGSTLVLTVAAMAARCAGTGTLRSLSASGGISEGLILATIITKTM